MGKSHVKVYASMHSYAVRVLDMHNTVFMQCFLETKMNLLMSSGRKHKLWLITSSLKRARDAW